MLSLWQKWWFLKNPKKLMCVGWIPFKKTISVIYIVISIIYICILYQLYHIIIYISYVYIYVYILYIYIIYVYIYIIYTCIYRQWINTWTTTAGEFLPRFQTDNRATEDAPGDCARRRFTREGLRDPGWKMLRWVVEVMDSMSYSSLWYERDDMGYGYVWVWVKSSGSPIIGWLFLKLIL